MFKSIDMHIDHERTQSRQTASYRLQDLSKSFSQVKTDYKK